jgi:acetyl-CoA C-acetyltransferase
MMGVAVIGGGHSVFGTRRDVNIPELCWEAMKPALEKANLEPKDIDFFVVGNLEIWSSEARCSVNHGGICGFGSKGVHES